MATRVVVLGAGFGGLELASTLSETFGDEIEVTLIDKADHFIFGFSKLEIMFGRETPEEVRLYYRNVVKPGVRFRQEIVTAIDPDAKRVTTDGGSYEADYLLIALGADYDQAATPGLLEGGNEFYSVAGATRLRDVLPNFKSGKAIVGVTSTPFKCPPAPSEASLLLHDYLSERGLRGNCEISLVMPFGVPVPPSPAASKSLLAAFAERDIRFVGDHLVRALDPVRKVAILDDGSEMPYDLFLGIPKHKVPDVVAASGMTEDGWIPVRRADLKTRYPGVYAVGDVTSVGTAKAGTFSENAAKVVAASIIAELGRGAAPDPYKGNGACFIEWGAHRVGRVDVEFFTGPSPSGEMWGPSVELVAGKQDFKTTRERRWFGMA